MGLIEGRLFHFRLFPPEFCNPAIFYLCVSGMSVITRNPFYRTPTHSTLSVLCLPPVLPFPFLVTWGVVRPPGAFPFLVQGSRFSRLTPVGLVHRPTHLCTAYRPVVCGQQGRTAAHILAVWESAGSPSPSSLLEEAAGPWSTHASPPLRPCIGVTPPRPDSAHLSPSTLSTFDDVRGFPPLPFSSAIPHSLHRSGTYHLMLSTTIPLFVYSPNMPLGAL